MDNHKLVTVSIFYFKDEKDAIFVFLWRGEEKTTGRGGHGRDQEVELMVSVASLELITKGGRKILQR